MPQDESLKKVQSNSISLNVAMCDDDDDGGGEGDAGCERLTFATEMHSRWRWYSAASCVCVNCQRPGSILPPLLELCGIARAMNVFHDMRPTT